MRPLGSSLATVFGERGPDILVEAPGRVNLMGDHIDYLGFDVLPMALAQRIRLFARARDDGMIRVSSTTRGADVISFPTDPNRSAQSDQARNAAASATHEHASGHWSNYVRAAVHGLSDSDRHTGFDAVVDSDLPEAAGLSSSSALVVAAALAFLHVNNEAMQPIELASRLAEAERQVGTQGGGMDQAVCLLARAGSAARIGFAPLRVTHVPIPPAWRFVVANSLQRAEKGGPEQAAYNQRAREAGDALARVRTLLPAGAHDAWELLEAGRRILDPRALRRFQHAVTEARRVDHADAALRAADPTRFGQLMDQSHASLRDDFDVSTPSLDTLAALLRSAGAHGARLTGAGLGGSVVALCPTERIDSILDALDRQYYGVRTRTGPFDRFRFLALPSAGACVVCMTGPTSMPMHSDSNQ